MDMILAQQAAELEKVYEDRGNAELIRVRAA